MHYLSRLTFVLIIENQKVNCLIFACSSYTITCICVNLNNTKLTPTGWLRYYYAVEDLNILNILHEVHVVPWKHFFTIVKWNSMRWGQSYVYEYMYVTTYIYAYAYVCPP